MDVPPESSGTLGRYRLLLRLASGGMGTVHAARVMGEHGFSRLVAVKLLHPHLAEDEETVARFLEEARIASRVKHPHVVSVLDVGDRDRMPFLVLDYVHGLSLDALLRAARTANEPVPVDIASAILVDVLEGLHAAHEAADDAGRALGIVHRDVSPHNILVSRTGAAYVTDFGIAKVKDRVRLTGTNDILGKPGYMAPEQVLGRTATAATDLHGAGIVLWETLTGQKLHGGMEQQVLAAIERKPFPAPSTHRSELPPALDALAVAMLAHDAGARPATALVCAAALRAAVPPASASAVAEWMLGYAQERLDRVEASLRAEPVPVSARPEPVVDDTPTITVADPPRPRRARAAGIAVGLLAVAGITIGVRAAGQPREAPVASAVTETPSVTPAASASPAPSAAPPPAPPATASAAVPAPVRTRPPAVGASRARCAVPYEEVDGIKRWKRECLTSPR